MLCFHVAVRFTGCQQYVIICRFHNLCLVFAHAQLITWAFETFGKIIWGFEIMA